MAVTAAWSKRIVLGAYFEGAQVNGRSLSVRATVNGRWTVRVDGKPARGSYGTADAARAAAEQAARRA